MLYFSRAKIIAILLTLFAGFVAAAPNFMPQGVMQYWPNFLPNQPLRLGLDLQGGAHLLLAMDRNEIKKDWLAGIRDGARQSLSKPRNRSRRIRMAGLGIQNGEVTVKLRNADDRTDAKKELESLITPIGNAILGSSGNDIEIVDGSEPNVILVRPTEAGLESRVSNAATASIETINRRINAIGTAESTVVRQGSDRILVQFPGLSDTTELKELIGKTARLSFHAVHPSMSAADAKLSSVPAEHKIYDSVDEEGPEAYLLRETPIVHGDELADAQPGFDGRTGEPVITFRFNRRGSLQFGEFTRNNVNRPFAIVLDDKVLSAPVIREPIQGGVGQISGNFSVEETNLLSLQLRSGALPTELTIVEERTVGPSLGADSVEAGTTAAVIGLTAALIATVLAYGTFGVYAVIGLFTHGLLILALMTAIGTTLTLPGIAGFVLSIGMAVDANVLIFERIREESRAGRSAIAALDNGFSRAIVTIADSQLTTLIAGAIMFWLGSGPIRGFAVTLSLGIITSIFAAVTVVRLLVALWLRNAKGNKSKLEVPV